MFLASKIPLKKQINGLFFNLWAFGSNSLVAWMPTRLGIDILSVPKVRLFNIENPESRVFHGQRQMEMDEFRQTSKLVDSEPMEIRLEFTIGDDEAGLTEAEVEEIFRNYATFLKLIIEQSYYLILLGFQNTLLKRKPANYLP